MQLNQSVRVLRLRLRRLLTEGHLIEGRDCRRDDYVDETHFIWRVDPAAFVRASGSQPVIRFATQAATQFRSLDDQSDNRVQKAGGRPADEVGQTLPKVDNPSSSLQREMIDLLKGQLSAKDGQIADLSEQNKKLNDVNLKLVAQTVQQSDRIQTLLRLTEGKMELADTVTKAGSGTATPDSNPGDHVADSGNDFGNQPPSSSRDWGSDLAA
jgi:hypothetical protein